MQSCRAWQAHLCAFVLRLTGVCYCGAVWWQGVLLEEVPVHACSFQEKGNSASFNDFFFFGAFRRLVCMLIFISNIYQ